MSLPSVLGGLALAGLAIALHDVALVIFGGILVGVLLRGTSTFVASKTRVPSPVALALTLLAIAAGAAAALWYGGALLAPQVAALQSDFPNVLRRAYESVRQSPWGPLVPPMPSPNEVLGSGLAVLQRATGLISTTIGGFVGVAVMVFVGICLAAEPELYLSGVVGLFRPDRQARIRSVFIEIGAALRSWLFARVVSMCAIAIFVSIGLWVLQLPFPLVLGGLAGLLAFIPNIGALLSALPAVAFGLAIGIERAALVIALYWLAHFIDDFVVIPIAERRMVHLPPALTITVQLALGMLTGVVGIAFAAPLTATAIVLVRRLWIEDAEGSASRMKAVR
jgi:predicted PurR-regulated permease PerM